MTYLYSNTSYKAVPNPPAQIQTAINEEVRKFQGILDSIEVEIQLSQRYFKKKQEQKRAQQEAEKDNNAQGKNQEENNEPEKVDSNVNAASDDPGVTKDGTDGNDQADYERADNDNDMLNDLMDNNNGFGDMEGMVEGFDDFNNLLDAGSNDSLQRGEGAVADDGMGNDDVGGLFGADFDFMMPTE